MRASSSLSLSATKIALFAGLAAIGALAAPAACAFPGYTFNEPEPGSGGSGGNGTPANSSSKTASSSSNTSSTTSSSSGMGGGSSSMSTAASGPACGMGNSVCVTAAPGGWTGYFALFDGPAGMDPGCTMDFPMDAYTGNGGLTMPAVTCSACSCGNPTGQTCTVGMFNGVGPLFVSNKTCAAQMMGSACGFSINVVADGSCYTQGGLPAGNATCGDPVGMTCPNANLPCDVGARLGPAAASGGSCKESTQMPTKPAPSWGSLGHACGFLGATMGCNIGQLCLPNPSAPYQAGVCISKAGDNMCPQTYPNKHLFYDDFTDTRDCTPCKCGAVAGASCATTINLYSDGGCANLLAAIPANGCADLGGNPAVSGRKSVNTTFQGSCAVDPTGGVATGSVTGTNPVTYCCR